jgi:hypothetical protein
LGCSSFEALYGYSPKHFAIPDVTSLVYSVQQWLQERKVQQELIKQHLNRATLRMKHQADKGRTERQFNVGDLVFLKIQPYVQSSLDPRSNQKLAFKFYGTYVVSEEYEVVHQRFPQAPAYRHAGFLGRGDVMNPATGGADEVEQSAGAT